MRHGLIALLVAFLLASQLCAADPTTTVTQSEQVLSELVAIPGKQIPASLLAEAQGLAIVPRVIKIGFVAGARRGHGVVLVRDASGNWGLPQFIQLTGGSLGWQAGVQGTDVVLVFTTRRSVEGLLKGKFTIGVDAAAAAGPVGRNASAATDTTLQAEILSYSRSRGLFLGASIDGTAIEMDQAANATFYGSPDANAARLIPEQAVRLRNYVTTLTRGDTVGVVAPMSASGLPMAGNIEPAIAISQVNVDALRQSLIGSAAQLSQILDPAWDRYLALPIDIQNPRGVADVTALDGLYGRFEQVAAGPQYQQLVARPEFQATQQLLRQYIEASRAVEPAMVLPPPPVQAATR